SFPQRPQFLTCWKSVSNSAALCGARSRVWLHPGTTATAIARQAAPTSRDLMLGSSKWGYSMRRKGRAPMKKALFFVLGTAFILAPVAMLAQSKPTAATYITDEEVKAVNALPGIDRTIKVVDIGPENFAVGVIHRAAPAGRGAAAGTGAGAARGTGAGAGAAAGGAAGRGAAPAAEPCGEQITAPPTGGT